ncbi:hypothetical protein ACFVWY_19530 [Streptomyces sp. NPDC058195]|uniref:hypothetical protein n=1 Tax=Streptomyces sp. NPDC058195 TaxID=3346375 RepID=UPI0036E601D0
MQTTEATALRASEFDHSRDEHPVGGIALGAGGRLGLRSRILGSTDTVGENTGDLPWTTMTWN